MPKAGLIAVNVVRGLLVVPIGYAGFVAARQADEPRGLTFAVLGLVGVLLVIAASPRLWTLGQPPPSAATGAVAAPPAFDAGAAHETAPAQHAPPAFGQQPAPASPPPAEEPPPSQPMYPQQPVSPQPISTSPGQGQVYNGGVYTGQIYGQSREQPETGGNTPPGVVEWQQRPR